MRWISKAFLAALVALAAGCGVAPVAPQTPAQAVYQAHGSYAAGLVILLQYKALPDCAPGAPSLCKDAAKMKELLDSDDEAFRALQSAQAIVRGDSGPLANKAARDAEAAIRKFRAQTSTVKVTP